MLIRNLILSSTIALSAPLFADGGWEDPFRAAESIEDFLIAPTDSFKLQSDKLPLDPSKIAYDIDVLITALTNGYSGRHKHDQRLFSSMIEELEKLKDNTYQGVRYTDYQNKVRNILETVTDNHLYVMQIPSIEQINEETHTKECRDCLSNPMAGQSSYRVEVTEMGGKRVLEIDIGDFMIPQESKDGGPSVKGMLEEIIATPTSTYDVIFVDLFDNPGGSIATVFDLWSVLQGGYNGRNAVFQIEDTYNPVSYALQQNSMMLQLAFLKGMNKYMDEMLGHKQTVSSVVGDALSSGELLVSKAITEEALESMIENNPSSIMGHDIPVEIILDRAELTDFSRDTDTGVYVMTVGKNNYNDDPDLEPYKRIIGEIQKKPIVIGINEHSASASELFTEGFHFNDNATTVGHDSMGALHFMNPAMLLLKNTSLVVSIPTGQFNFGDQNLSIEGKGEHADQVMHEKWELVTLINDIKDKELEYNDTHDREGFVQEHRSFDLLRQYYQQGTNVFRSITD